MNTTAKQAGQIGEMCSRLICALLSAASLFTYLIRRSRMRSRPREGQIYG